MSISNLRFSLLFILFCLINLSGCKDLLNKGDVEIRIRNNSSYLMQDIQIGFTGDNFSYGDLPASKVSEYKSVGKAYRYGYVETIIEDRKVILQPNDFVGEKPLDPGKYTFVLNALEQPLPSEDYTFSLTLELNKD